MTRCLSDVKAGWEDAKTTMLDYHAKHGRMVASFQMVWTVVTLVIFTAALCAFREISTLTFEQRFLMSPDFGPELLIVGTSIRGREAVERFRAHLACFSEAGRWEYNNTPRHIPWNRFGDPFVHLCDDIHKSAAPENIAHQDIDVVANQGGDWKVREVLKWTWQTNSSCPMLPADRIDFCKRMGSGRNILIVGDSINHQISWAFMNNLMTNYAVNGWSMSAVRSTQGEEVCGDVLEGGGFNISWVRNDRVSPTEFVNDDMDHNFFEWPWVAQIEKWNVKILILNRGAHYEWDDRYAASLRLIMPILRSRYPDLIVLYRNTPPGHLNCATYKAPLRERQPPTNLPHNWGLFPSQNELAKGIVERSGYIYMDLDTMLSLRPDGHVHAEDCLHYCIPGPLDMAVQLFYNILTLIS